jgi:hypothetical protein
MKTTTRRGLRRLTILAATLAALTTAGALTLDALTYPPAAPWALIAAVILAAAGLAAAAAWLLLRALGWVIDGFTARRATFPTPGKN